MFLFLRLWVLVLLLGRPWSLTQAITSSRGGAMTKALVTEARFSSLINNGGSFGGTIYVNGNHHTTGDGYVSGDHNVTGVARGGQVSTSGTMWMNNHNLDNLSEINTGHQTWGAHGELYMNGYNISMGGGNIV